MRFETRIKMIAARLIFATVAVLGLSISAEAQSGLRQVPMVYCSLSSISASTGLASDLCASFTGTGSGTNLTASSVTGSIAVGLTITGTGSPSGTTIVSQTSGTPGGAGVYVTSNATTSNAASLTANGLPIASQVTYAVICAYTQGVVWRDDGGAPTGTPGTGGQGLSAGQCMPYNATFSALRFIQQTSGAVLGVSFYH